MGGGEKKENHLYSVLGLEKECSSTDLKTAYRNLAKRWHPDRCAASRNSTIAEESKKKFQDIQEAYSVLSDENNRLLYDLGIYDEEDDENNNGMGDFLNEMVATMSQIKPTSDNEEDSFKELQDLFDEIVRPDNIVPSASTSSSSQAPILTPSYTYSYSASGVNNKRSYSVASSSRTSLSTTMSEREDVGRAEEEARETSSSRKPPSWNGRRRRVSSIDASSDDLADNRKHG